ncbi:hypothetical protein CYMTET_48719 [Cymbomonas tetramitiformis]|uniref:PLAC8 family protein n=1 Tax=Cymbomonas tetramitiformis TaxID=36881 RepID=A0AAE0EVG2_9CHLO|nr:hypothetical protein CYMTET_48719 [Cymbomonas tetramitiformis]
MTPPVTQDSFASLREASDSIQPKEWHTGLFDRAGIALENDIVHETAFRNVACCCPSCAYGQLMATMPETSYPFAGKRCSSCCFHFAFAGCLNTSVSCIFIPLGSIFSWVVSTGARRAIRKKYNIKGACLQDCIISGFCEPCSLMRFYGYPLLESADSEESAPIEGNCSKPSSSKSIEYDWYWDRGTKLSKLIGPCFCLLLQD